MGCNKFCTVVTVFELILRNRVPIIQYGQQLQALRLLHLLGIKDA